MAKIHGATAVGPANSVIVARLGASLPLPFSFSLPQ